MADLPEVEALAERLRDRASVRVSGYAQVEPKDAIDAATALVRLSEEKRQLRGALAEVHRLAQRPTMGNDGLVLLQFSEVAQAALADAAEADRG